MSRKKYLENADPFADNNDMPQATFEELSGSVYGAIKEIDAKKQIANPLNIKEIFPDPSQPRRSIPSALREKWLEDPGNTFWLFKNWVDIVEDERGSAFDVIGYIHSEEIERPESIGPLEENFLSLIELAVSIRNDGLTNPITVAPYQDHYIIETGERRWLSFHLLRQYTRDEKWDMIHARIMENVDIWRQAAENNARSDLNAISRARQFSILLMDLLQERGDTFQSFDDFAVEQEFYAQVADGNQHRIPKGTSERLLTSTGLKNPQQLRFYRRLLTLPNEVWELADDLNWTEYFIRDLRTNADSDKQLIQMAYEKATEMPQSVSVDTVSVKKVSKDPKPRKTREKPAPGSKQYYTTVMRALSKSGAGKVHENEEALSMLQEMRRWVEEQERLLRRYLEND